MGSDMESDMKDRAIKVNDKAPDVTLPDQSGNKISLKDFKGQTVVLFFYPKANTPGCTIEACEFRDTYAKLKKLAVVLGISGDTSSAQKKFEEKFSLPFPLLADADRATADRFGILKEKNMYGKKVKGIVRTTYIIGPDGKVRHIFAKVKPEGHAEEVLAWLKADAKG